MRHATHPLQAADLVVEVRIKRLVLPQSSGEVVREALIGDLELPMLAMTLTRRIRGSINWSDT
jgi:hypothetical protein